VITPRDVVLGLFVAWRLLLFDRAALQYADATLDGFWKSFYAAAVALPAAFILRSLFIEVDPAFDTVTVDARIVAIYALDYVFQWLSFPLLMIYIADGISRPERYLGFIVARNWAQVIQIVILLPAVAIFAASEPGTANFGSVLLVAAHLITWVYAWFIARTMLEVSAITAALVVIAELILSVLISLTGEALIAAGAPAAVQVSQLG